MQQALEQGARNLLLNCAGCEPEQKVLLVHETEGDGYYDPELTDVLRIAAEEIGLVTESYGVPLNRTVTDPDAALVAKMMEADRTIFLARLGDQVRFRAQNATMDQIICYALDREMLASTFGTVAYGTFEKLKQLINAAVDEAQDIQVTCPAGTDFRGGPSLILTHGEDVTRKRFPVSVFSPLPAARFSGRVAQKGFLTGTGSNYYTPWSCEIEETLMVNFEGNRIIGFGGSAHDIAAARAHYEMVGKKYGIDAYFVHSWHAGIHPGCAYSGPAGAHMERWSGSAFGNPRLLHFHTCGDYPPGEISLNVLDPTVRVDGIALWEDGILYPERVRGGAELLAANPDLAEAFAQPATQVGQAPCGGLRL